MECPNCGEPAPEGAKFCEACGHDLNTEPLPACVSCGEREVAEEGYCLSCGHKQPEERDHMSFVSGAAAAVTDRGKRHRHNEDAVAIAETPDGGVVLVVCDGVSSTSGSAEASLRAASAARDLLVVGLTPTDEDEDQIVANAEELLVRAVEEAQSQASASADVQAAEEAAGGAEVNPIHDGGSPSSTFVAVVAKPVDDGIALTTAWVGDSRAYWVGSTAQRLTGDDHELGGSLVRWLGADTINATPEIVTTVVPAGGHVFVCSDGLWRYAAEPQELSELTERLLSDGHLGVDLATAMVAFANESGGHDNISVALWTDNQDLIGPAEPTPAEPVPTDVDLTDADPADPDPTTVEAENSAPQPHLEDGGDGQ
jgi:serine/threonine protein phosphatase PrpC